MSGGHQLSSAAAGKVTTMTTTKSHWIPLGITDEQSVCDQCGKQHLKRVVVLQHDETFEQRRVGTTCAGHLIGDRRIAEQTISSAEWLQRVVDKLRADGIAAAKEWAGVRGLGTHIIKVGNPNRDIWQVTVNGCPTMIVTDQIIRRKTF